MSLKQNLALIILGLFLIKIGLIDNARNFHFKQNKVSHNAFNDRKFGWH